MPKQKNHAPKGYRTKETFKVMKVFDCQWNPGMPDDVREGFFSYFRTMDVCNDVYVDWVVGDNGHSDEDQPKVEAVNQWLRANGAVDGESVLIRHWW